MTAIKRQRQHPSRVRIGDGVRARTRGRRQGRTEHGFALALAVLVATVLMMLVAALIFPVVTDTTTGMRATSLVENRTTADSILNELFSEIRLDTRPVPVPQLLGRVAPGKTVSAAGPIAGWATWDQTTNAAVPCPDQKATCYYYALAAPTTLDGGAGDYVVAEVTVRSRCKVATTCVYRRYQQRWHRRRFLDFVLFTDLETLSPSLYLPAEASTINPTANCIKPAGDGELADPGGPVRSRTCNEVIFNSPGAVRNEVNGPIHTNDPQFWVCGSPKFSGLVEATSASPLKPYPGGCVTAAPEATGTVRRGTILPLPNSVTEFADITPASSRFTGATKFVLAGKTMTVTRSDGTTSTESVPLRGLIYVDGDLTVEGAANGVTLVSSAAVHISGDLTGIDIGLVAESDVVIAYSPSTRVVEASVLSRAGTISNDGLRQPPPVGVIPKLDFTGAMVSKFHPVSGLFDSKSSSLVSGMVSVMTYPAIAPNPPYFLEPVQAAWERVDFTEIPLGGDTVNVTGGLTGRPDRSVTGPAPACATSAAAPPYLVSCLAP